MRRRKTIILILIGVSTALAGFNLLDAGKSDAELIASLRATQKLSLPVQVTFRPIESSIQPGHDFELSAMITVSSPLDHVSIKWHYDSGLELLHFDPSQLPSQLDPDTEYTVNARFFHHAGNDQNIRLAISSGPSQIKTEIEYHFQTLRHTQIDNETAAVLERNLNYMRLKDKLKKKSN